MKSEMTRRNWFTRAGIGSIVTMALPTAFLSAEDAEAIRGRVNTNQNSVKDCCVGGRGELMAHLRHHGFLEH